MSEAGDIRIVDDVLRVLDSDDALLTAEAADLQAQIDALLALVAINQEKQVNSTRFRQLALDIRSGSAAGSLTIPASPPPPGTPEALGSGITQN